MKTTIRTSGIVPALLSLSLFLLSCDKKNHTEPGVESRTTKTSGRIRSEDLPNVSGSLSEDPAIVYDPAQDYKNKKGLAMDRDPALQKALTEIAPAWLAIGKEISPEIVEGKSEEIAWTVGKLFEIKTPPQRIAVDGKVTTADEAEWQRAVLSPSSNRALFLPGDYLNGVNVFDIVHGEVEQNSGQPIPTINYDDSRRWTIGWSHFLAEDLIIGTVNEDDFSGHTTVKTSIYTYDLATRTLSQVRIPEPLKESMNDGIHIEAVSGSSVLVSSNHGYYTITIK